MHGPILAGQSGFNTKSTWVFVHKAMGLVDEPFGVPSSHPSIFRTRFFQKPGSRKEVGLSSKQQQKQETLLVTQKKPVPSTRLESAFTL